MIFFQVILLILLKAQNFESSSLFENYIFLPINYTEIIPRLTSSVILQRHSDVTVVSCAVDCAETGGCSYFYVNNSVCHLFSYNNNLDQNALEFLEMFHRNLDVQLFKMNGTGKQHVKWWCIFLGKFFRFFVLIESCDFVNETGQVTCYKIMTGDDVTWNDANATCVEQGGFLVEHRNNEEFEVLTSFMNETGWRVHSLKETSCSLRQELLFTGIERMWLGIYLEVRVTFKNNKNVLSKQ